MSVSLEAAHSSYTLRRTIPGILSLRGDQGSREFCVAKPLQNTLVAGAGEYQCKAEPRMPCMVVLMRAHRSLLLAADTKRIILGPEHQQPARKRRRLIWPSAVSRHIRAPDTKLLLTNQGRLTSRTPPSSAHVPLEEMLQRVPGDGTTTNVRMARKRGNLSQPSEIFTNALARVVRSIP